MTAAESRAPERDDARLVAALRAGDAEAFAQVVDADGGAMLRLARGYVGSRSVAEEVVQETWAKALAALDRFEARSSLRTWLYRILVNTATTRAEREGRSVPFSALGGDDEPAVAAERFHPADHPRWPGHWSSPPSAWPEERLLAAETRAVLAAAIERLPGAQRAVVSLRDLEGWDADEVCNVLGLTESNQRVLLHRGRSRVRQALEDYLG